MSKVQTAADVAHKITKECGSTDCFLPTRCKEILEEWAKELQPQPDESEEDVAIRIVKTCLIQEKLGILDTEIKLDITKAEALIARHTAAKVAEAEARGWNRGAEAARKDDAESFLVGEDILTIPLPPYQKNSGNNAE